MNRREFITLLGGGAAAWPLAAGAQQAAMPVVGFLHPASPNTFADRVRGFRQGLKETGFVEGENVVIEYRWADDQLDRLPALATELVLRQVAVIAAPGGPAPASAAKAATATIPVVFLVAEDPVGLGLVASLAAPGGNLTGINFFNIELSAKRLELLRVLVPGATRVAALVNPANVANRQTTVRDLEAAGRAIGLQIQVLNAGTSGEIEFGLRNFCARAARRRLRRPRPLFHQPAGSIGPSGIALRDPCDLCVARFRRSRWSDELRSQPLGSVSSGRRLYWSRPQGREASGLSGRTGKQVRTGHQPPDGHAAGPRRAARPARACR